MGFIIHGTWNILSGTYLIVKTCEKQCDCPLSPLMLHHLKNKPRGEETFLSAVLIQRFDRCVNGVRFGRKGPADRAVLLVVTIEMGVTGDFCAACGRQSFFPRDPGCSRRWTIFTTWRNPAPAPTPHIIQTLSTLQPAPLSDLYRVGVALLDASFISRFIVLRQ